MIETPENRIMLDRLAQETTEIIQAQIKSGWCPTTAIRVTIAYSYETLLNRLAHEGRITINDNADRPNRG